jgi:hypothetical protein
MKTNWSVVLNSECPRTSCTNIDQLLELKNHYLNEMISSYLSSILSEYYLTLSKRIYSSLNDGNLPSTLFILNKFCY